MCDQQSLRSACAYAQSDQSLCKSLEYSMKIKLLAEHHLEFQGFKGGCTGSYESTLVKMQHCWKSHATAHFLLALNILTPGKLSTTFKPKGTHHAPVNTHDALYRLTGFQLSKNLGRKIVNIFLILSLNICFGCSKESFH